MAQYKMTRKTLERYKFPFLWIRVDSLEMLMFEKIFSENSERTLQNEGKKCVRKTKKKTN